MKLTALVLIMLIVASPVVFAVQVNEGSVSVTDLTTTSAKVTWTTDMQANGFVDYGISTSNMNTAPETGGVSSFHSVALTSLSAGQRYFYKVRSSDGYTSNDESDFHEFTTLLAKPAGLEARDVQYSSASIRWNAVSGASGYRLFIGNQMVVETTSREYTATGLQPQTAYTASVRALDSAQRMSEPSDAVSFTTLQQPYNITFIQVTDITNTSAKVSWKTDRPIASLVKFDTDITLDREASDTVPKTTHSLTLLNLDSDTRYYYSIVAGTTESERQFFFTLAPGGTSAAISDITVSAITTDSATIKWRTNVAADSEVLYGTTDALGQRDGSSAETTEHSVTLSNLLSTSTYHFRVSSNEIMSDYQTFETIASAENFLTLDTLPSIVSNGTINITGITRPNSRVYIFLNGNNIAQVREQITGTRFGFAVHLNSLENFQDIPGNNQIQVSAWDVNGNRDSEIVYVQYDSLGPRLEVIGVPDVTKGGDIVISGESEIGARIEFYLDNQSKARLELAERNFTQTLNIRASGNFTLKVVAKDEAGNENVFEKLMIVDSQQPTDPQWDTTFRDTHFNLYTISGTTEPRAKIEVTNFGVYRDCNEAYRTLEYTSCDQFMRGVETIYQIDPMSYGLGMKRETTADDDGHFEVTVALVHKEVSQAAAGTLNNLHFNITDRAGNFRAFSKTVRYKPGCKDWRAGKVESFPSNIYSSDLSAGTVQGSMIFPIAYYGAGVPKVTQVAIMKDTAETSFNLLSGVSASLNSSSNNYLSLDQANGQRFFNVGNSKFTKYDSSKKAFLVYVPVKIGPYSGPAESLPDVLNVNLAVKVSYTVEGVAYQTMIDGRNVATDRGSASCEVYPAAAFDMQKPEDISKWLSPEQINKSIQALDEVINATEDIVDVARKASYFGLVACGGMIAWQYASSFFKDSSTNTAPDANGCSSQQQSMEKVYYVCDRVMCPASPPECSKFTAMGPENGQYKIYNPQTKQWEGKSQTDYNTELQNHDAWRKAYDKLPPNGKPNTFEAWKNAQMREPNKIPTGLQPYKEISVPTFQTTLPDKAVAQLDFIPVQNGQVGNQYIPYYAQDPKLRQEYDTALRNAANTCGEGTLIVSRRIEQSGPTTPGTLRASDVERVKASKCVHKSPEELLNDGVYGENGIPKTDQIIGCYSAECPQYDKTKCPNYASFFSGSGSGVPNINPPEGLWASLRCTCLPGILNHLENYLKIMKGAKKCLEQAQIGEVRGGFCERLLAQFACDLLIELYKYGLSYFSADASGGSDVLGGAGSSVRSGIQNYKENTAQITDSLSSRYSNVAKERFGLSSDQIVHKACMFSITQDLSMLDGLLENFVDSVEIEPTVMLQAESRAYGYDPFTGKMSVGYKIYVGVVPGGETDLKVYLRCDPTAADGKYCGSAVSPREINLNGRNHLTKNDPPINQNIIFTVDDSPYWYNQAVMELKYKVGTESKDRTLVKQIWKKGDLAYGCTFSAAAGITCESIHDFTNQSGIVELYKIGSGSKVTPPAPQALYTNGNNIAAFVKIRNQYKKDQFYVRFERSDGQTVEYPIMGSGQMTGAIPEGEQYFNLWFENVQVSGNTLSNAQNDPVYENRIDLGLIAEYKVVPVNLRQGVIKVDWQAYYPDCEGCADEMGVHTMELRENNPADLTRTITSTRVQGGTYRIIRITLMQPIAVDRNQPIRISVQSGNQMLLDSQEMVPASPSGTTASTSPGTRTVTMNALEDTGGDGKGDTPILYDTQSQRSQSTYRVSAASTNNQPFVDFIEPVGEFLPSDTIPLGFNIWTDANTAEEIKVTIKGSGLGNGDMYCEINKDGTISSNPECKLTSGSGPGRVLYSQGKTPFHELYLTWKSGTVDTYKNRDAMYDITVTVISKDAAGAIKTSNPVTRRFYGGTDYTREKAMIWIGMENCNNQEMCIQPNVYQTSTAPVVVASG